MPSPTYVQLRQNAQAHKKSQADKSLNKSLTNKAPFNKGPNPHEIQQTQHQQGLKFSQNHNVMKPFEKEHYYNSNTFFYLID